MINQDFFLALEDLEREKGISQVEFISALENALVIAYKKSSRSAKEYQKLTKEILKDAGR